MCALAEIDFLEPEKKAFVEHADVANALPPDGHVCTHKLVNVCFVRVVQCRTKIVFDDRIVRQQNEISMWISQLQQVIDSFKRVESGQDSAFGVSYSFDELFGGATDLKFVPSAESLLRTCVTALQSYPGPIEVIGHTGGGQTPQVARERYPGSWDYAAAAAGRAARRRLLYRGSAQDALGQSHAAPAPGHR